MVRSSRALTRDGERGREKNDLARLLSERFTSSVKRQQKSDDPVDEIMYLSGD